MEIDLEDDSKKSHQEPISENKNKAKVVVTERQKARVQLLIGLTEGICLLVLIGEGAEVGAAHQEAEGIGHTGAGAGVTAGEEAKAGAGVEAEQEQERSPSYRSRRYLRDRGTSEKGDGKAGQGRSSVSRCGDSISSLPEERDYSYYKLSHRHENQYDGDQKKSELHNRSSERCYDFTKGKCQRGSGCRFVHHDAASQGGLHAEDEAKEKHRRRDADASFQQRIESHKADDTPCKFFAEGHCHRGDVCRFSHQDMAHVGSKEKLHECCCKRARRGIHRRSSSSKIHTNPMENNYENMPQEAPQRPLPSQLHNGAPIASERHQQVAAVPTQSMPESTSVQQSSVMKGDIPAHGEGSGVIPFPVKAVLPSPNIGQRFQSPMLGSQGQQNLQALQNGQIQQNYNLRGQNQQRLPTPYVGNQQKVNLNGQIQHNIPLPPHIPHGQPVVNQIVPSQPSVPLIYGVQGEQHHDFSSQSQQNLPSLPKSSDPTLCTWFKRTASTCCSSTSSNTRAWKSNEQNHQNSHQRMQTGECCWVCTPSPFLNLASTRPVAPAAIPTISILPGQGSLVQQHQDSASGRRTSPDQTPPMAPLGFQQILLSKRWR
ncbi:hypothetical protein J5N97_016676 [Dioscorea zingiberensis]|uniref:C3H1-type domain-containing protein n=1 Tax=Dioscorea zingiberensis TaxID=325984 RepID=A0A9D5CK04_9LILI|nr:hypothetical protein J5N97_016676 [Dioscorea zingiberensis]